MANLDGFDANTVEPTSFDPIPAGDYVAVIIESQMKATKASTGSYLQLEFEIIEGEYKGRHPWARLNLNNPNETAVKIARGELSAICKDTVTRWDGRVLILAHVKELLEQTTDKLRDICPE